MSVLFKLEGTIVIPNEETLIIPPFDEIWSRDKSEDKWMALREFAYIEFMTSMLKSNPYKGYSKDVRDEKIREDIIKVEDWKPDELVKQAMLKIEEFQTDGSESYTLLVDALKAKDSLQNFLRTFDLDERNRHGGMILKPRDVTSSLLDLDKVVTAINTLKKKVEEDIFESVKTRGGKIISPFANPNSIL